MASYNELNALIDAYINRNGVQAITGQILNGVLKAMVEQLGRGYTIMGAAIPTTDPGTPDGPECYFASAPGTYTDFDGLQVAPGELALLCYTPSDGWTKATIYEGFQTVGATIDGNVGTPSVGVSYADGVLSFDFHNMKGNPGQDGQDGAAAGFGTIGADITGGVGTPGVTVDSSGPATAKNLQFHFTNLKGETGVTSVVATVDNTTGTPACTVSLEGQQLTLAFSGLKGAQGDTGSSVDYPFTIVNNLTTDDATQALSAAQGVVLDGKVTQLEAKVDDIETEIDGGYEDFNTDSNNPYYGVDGTVFTSAGTNRTNKIPVIPGDVVNYKIYQYNNVYMLAMFDSNQTLLPNLSYPGTHVLAIGSITIPEGVSYIQATNRLSLFTSPEFYKYGLASKIPTLQVKKPNELYVSASGNDTNNGLTRQTALATINKAFSMIADGGCIYLIGDLRQTIDFSKAPLNVKIRNCNVYRARILGSARVACSAVAEHPTIFSLPCTWTFKDTYNFSTVFDDTTPSYPVTSPMPQMVGEGYELPCTAYSDRKTKGETVLADAISLMESLNENCMWQDPDTKTVYVKSVDVDLTGKYLEIPTRPCTLPVGTSGSGKTIEIENVNFLYSYGVGVDMSYCFSAILNNVSCYCASTTGVRFNCATAFVNKCIANGNAVDGFAAAGAEGTQDMKNGDNVIYNSCWAARNYDDGYSHHGGGRASYNGCLAEDSVIGDGFAFVGGCVAELYDCVARNIIGTSGCGFTVSGSPSPRASLVMSCFECIAENCKVAFVSGPATNVSDYVKLLCYLCIAIGGTTGYSSDDSAEMRLIDCGSSGVTNSVIGNPTIINSAKIE